MAAQPREATGPPPPPPTPLSSDLYPECNAICCHRLFAIDAADSTGEEARVLGALERLRRSISPYGLTSRSQKAVRRFFSDDEGGRDGWVGRTIIKALKRRHPELELERALAQMRFIEYPPKIGAGIEPHRDASLFDATSGRMSTHSFLLYLNGVEEGGRTAFLHGGQWGSGGLGGERCPGPVETICEVRPRRGSLLVFPHAQAHEGTAVWAERKWLLRGDLC